MLCVCVCVFLHGIETWLFFFFFPGLYPVVCGILVPRPGIELHVPSKEPHRTASEVLATSFVNILCCKMPVIYDFLRFFLLFLKQRTFREFGPVFVLT